MDPENEEERIALQALLDSITRAWPVLNRSAWAPLVWDLGEAVTRVLANERDPA